MLGTVVAARRKQIGLTQEEFADRVGVSRGTIAQLEVGIINWPRLETLQRIAQVLEVSISWLLKEGGIIPAAEDLDQRIAEFARANEKFATVAQAAIGDPDILQRLYEFVQVYQGRTQGPDAGNEASTR